MMKKKVTQGLLLFLELPCPNLKDSPYNYFRRKDANHLVVPLKELQRLKRGLMGGVFGVSIM